MNNQPKDNMLNKNSEENMSYKEKWILDKSREIMRMQSAGQKLDRAHEHIAWEMNNYYRTAEREIYNKLLPIFDGGVKEDAALYRKAQENKPTVCNVDVSANPPVSKDSMSHALRAKAQPQYLYKQQSFQERLLAQSKSSDKEINVNKQ